MSVEKNSNKGAGGGRVRSRWQLDFSSRSSHGMELLSPPGYTAGENRRKFNQEFVKRILFRSRLHLWDGDLQGGRPQSEDQAELGPGAGALQAGADEPVHHVDVRQHHLHLPDHDGLHDDVPALQDPLHCWPDIQSVRGARLRGQLPGSENCVCPR